MSAFTCTNASMNSSAFTPSSFMRKAKTVSQKEKTDNGRYRNHRSSFKTTQANASNDNAKKDLLGNEQRQRTSRARDELGPNEFVQLSAFKKAQQVQPVVAVKKSSMSIQQQTMVVAGVGLTIASLAIAKNTLFSSSSSSSSSMCEIIDGNKIAAEIRVEITEAVEKMKKITNGKTPGLAVVLVVERKDSQSYVRSKKKMCGEVGIRSEGTDLPEDATEEDALKVVKAYNEDPNIHGILVQLPMPKHINEERVLREVSYEKDVDGFHPLNIGALSQRGREEPRFVPCTPRWCIELLKRSNVEMKGKNAVVVGRSNVVGTPAALLLQRADATVTIVHSRTPNPEEFIKRADIVIAACGVTEYVKGSWLKPGAAVIDVGINAKDDKTKKLGYRLVGDCDFESCKTVAGKMTPVPGGVGTMTIAILLQNTLEGAARAYKVSKELGLKD